MGWWDPEGRPVAAKSAKLLRSCLCLWACEACGGTVASALPAACALELAHNLTLVHDDIQDGDSERRGRPTVWSVWGTAQGINAVDALQILSMRLLTEPEGDPRRRLVAAHVIASALLEVIEGQCLDVGLEGGPPASEATYRRLALAKTGALLGASLRAGAIMAGAPSDLQLALERAGRLLGLAFQLRDDWLGVWGDSSLTGKSCDGDLARRKQTYPVVAAYAAASRAQREELRRLYRTREPGGVQRLRQLLEELGGAELTAGAARAPARSAVAAIESTALCRDRGEEFADVANYVASRNS